MNKSKITNGKPSISLIIPTYNDENTILKQLEACEKILKKHCNDYEIIIADDDSRDATREILRKHFSQKKKFHLLFNKHNLGITRNVRQLYFRAKKDYIFFYSVDGDWSTQDAEKLIATLIKDHADIVIGKRMKKIGYTPLRHIVSFLHKLLPIVLFGVNTIDPGGIKIIRRELAQIPLTATSQFFEAEMIVRASLLKKKISWYPVVYKKIYYGSGKGGALSDAIRSAMDVLKLRIALWKKN